ncbi:MAG: hypothetical protein ACD_80C00088G0004 [uncultured bacterium (gcode 4)]|uniref:Uncharacterized protein n=1 Tax=uncultured bacterium (gcode 4) TaxID=1234023 RepID=K1YIT5_9BACT|nr:MAG: hypothetical protein ACD_80C00088G0004 [uncultured bacterium (gcode 4)]HBB04673.1 hypothetical protein [Candidatus Gracilibacteria bacterium]
METSEKDFLLVFYHKIDISQVLGSKPIFRVINKNMETLIIIGILVLIFSSWFQYHVRNIQNKEEELIRLANTIFEDLCNPKILLLDYHYIGQSLMLNQGRTKEELNKKKLIIKDKIGNYLLMYWYVTDLSGTNRSGIDGPSIYVQVTKKSYFDSDELINHRLIYQRGASIDEETAVINTEIKQKEQIHLPTLKRLRESRFRKA